LNTGKRIGDLQMDKEEVTLNIDDGKIVDLENQKIMVAIPIGGKRESDTVFGRGTSQDFEWVTYSYVNGLQPMMEEISKKKKKNSNESYSIRAVVDVRRKVIKNILKIE
jgi:hypothetical protein